MPLYDVTKRATLYLGDPTITPAHHNANSGSNFASRRVSVS